MSFDKITYFPIQADHRNYVCLLSADLHELCPSLEFPAVRGCSESSGSKRSTGWCLEIAAMSALYGSFNKESSAISLSTVGVTASCYQRVQWPLCTSLTGISAAKSGCSWYITRTRSSVYPFGFKPAVKPTHCTALSPGVVQPESGFWPVFPTSRTEAPATKGVALEFTLPAETTHRV